MTIDELLRTARSLPRGEQIDLAMELWESIEMDAADPAVTDAQKQELDRRLAAEVADPQPAQHWQSLRKKLLDGEL